MEKIPENWKPMCEYTSKILDKHLNFKISPQKIYNISPTGELFPVYDLYFTALKLEGYNQSIDNMGYINYEKDGKLYKPEEVGFHIKEHLDE